MSMAGGGLGKILPNWTFLGTKVNDPGGLFQSPGHAARPTLAPGSAATQPGTRTPLFLTELLW